MKLPVDRGASVLLAAVAFFVVSIIGVVSLWGCALVVRVPYWLLLFWIPLGAVVLFLIALKTKAVFVDFRNNGGLYYTLGVVTFAVAMLSLGIMTKP